MSFAALRQVDYARLRLAARALRALAGTAAGGRGPCPPQLEGSACAGWLGGANDCLPDKGFLRLRREFADGPTPFSDPPALYARFRVAPAELSGP